MISSFEISAIFGLEDAASEPLAKIAATLQEIGNLAEAANRALRGLDSVSVAAAARGIDQLAESLVNLNRNATGFAGGIEAAAAAAGNAAASASTKIDEVTAAYDRATAAQERFKQSARSPALGEQVYTGEIGGPDLVPYRQGGVGGPRTRLGPIIDHEAAEDMAAGALALGYAGGAGSAAGGGYGMPMVMPRGFGRGSAGTASPGPGGFTNWYAQGPGSGPTINMGGGGERPHDPSLDIPFPPQGSANEWRGGLYGRGPGGPGGGGGGGGRGGGGGGDEGSVIHFGLAEMAADWSVAEAFKGSAEEENAIARTLIGLQVDPDSPQGRSIAAQLRQTYRDAAVGTQFSEKNTATAGAIYARELGFTAKEGGVQRFRQSFPVALRAAEIAEQEGLGSMDSSLTAALEYAHMTRRYEPAQLEKSLNVLQQISTLTDNSMAAEESILKYVVPLGRAGGMDADRMAEITGFVQQSGYNSSTAGTGLSQLMLGILQSGGGINAHLEHGRSAAERELAGALHLDASGLAASRHENRGSLHMQARRNLGLVDAGGHVTVLNDQGGIDMDALINKITEKTAGMAPNAALKELIDAFGDRGGRIASLFTGSEGARRLHTFETNVESGARDFGAARVQAMLSGTVEQEFGQSMARLSDAANAATTPLLGLAHLLLSGTNSALDSGVEEMQQHPVLGGALGAAATLWAAHRTFRIGGGVYRLARRLLGGAAKAGAGGLEAGEAVVGAGEAAGGGLLAGLGGILGAVAPWLGVGGVGVGGGLLAGWGAHAVDAKVPWLRSLDNATEGLLGHLNPFSGGASPAVPAAQAARGAASPSAAANTFQIGPINLYGVGSDIKAMVEKLFDEMARKLAQALSHAAGPGQGQLTSPFNQGH